MLYSLQIRNLALIRDLNLDLAQGLTVLTGETGAGKSILVDAISLVLGDKANPQLIRHGSEQAEITATFGITAGSAAAGWMASHGFDGEDECIIRRILARQGRSRIFLNGHAISTSQNRELGELLVDLLGQNIHLRMVRADRQMDLLDRYAGLPEKVDQMGNSYRKWREAQETQQELLSRQEQHAEQREWRHFVFEELENASLREDEWEDLGKELQRLGSATQLRETVAAALSTLDGEPDGTLRQLTEVYRRIHQAQGKDPSLGETEKLLEGARIQAEEALNALQHYLQDLEADPERLAQISRRLQQLQDLQRKHHTDMAGLMELYRQMREEFATESAIGSPVLQAEERLQAARQDYQTLAGELSLERQKYLDPLARAIESQLHGLGMPHAVVEIRMESRPDNEGSWMGRGWDRAEIRISANPGHPPQSLSNVASGGELSRISLALQVLMAEPEGAETIIFDEVDVGVGGAVAERIGRLLRSLGQHHQVLCVTHLPQVAAHGHQHLKVQKSLELGQTETQIFPLDTPGRVDEIARMLGGIEISPSIRAAAEKLLSAC